MGHILGGTPRSVPSSLVGEPVASAQRKPHVASTQRTPAHALGDSHRGPYCEVMLTRPAADATDRPASEVLVLGSANMDVILRVPSLPAAGDTALGGDAEFRPGGKGANQAVAAALAGSRVSLAGCLGADAQAAAIRAALAAAGVDHAALRSVPDRNTGLAVVLVDADGENAIAVSPGANAAVQRADVQRLRERIASADVLLMQLEVPVEAVVAAAEVAAEVSTLVMLNLSPPIQLAATTLQRIGVLVVNRSEAEFLLGEKLPDVASMVLAAQRLRDLGPVSAVVTAGGLGAAFADSADTGHVPAVLVPVVDTAGAGDAFAGVLAAGLSSGLALRDAVERAVRAGAAAVQVPGAQLTSLPRFTAGEGVRTL
jgi:ribokinase